MNYRVKNIGIAVALAALAAILTSVYVVNYKRHVQHGEDSVTVLVAARDIPAGTIGADIIDQKMLQKETVPRKAVVAGAISSPDQLSQYIATQDVYEGEQRAYELEGDPHQVLAGTLKEGDHVDIVGTWESPPRSSILISRVVVRDLLVLKAPDPSAAGSAVTSSQDNAYVQLRATDAQTQKIIWIQKNSVSNGDGWHLDLRPPNGSLDSSNTIQDHHTMQFDGPGRRPH